MVKNTEGLGKVSDLIDLTLDFDSSNEGKFMVNPKFDADLQALKSELDKVKEDVEKSLKVLKVQRSGGLRGLRDPDHHEL